VAAAAAIARHEVVPGLLLGRRLRSAEAAGLPARSVVDLTSEFAGTPALRARRYVAVPMLDGVARSLAAVDAGRRGGAGARATFVRRKRGRSQYCSAQILRDAAQVSWAE
jgi:hypothetical protein